MKPKIAILNYHKRRNDLTNDHGLIEYFDETKNVIIMKIFKNNDYYILKLNLKFSEYNKKFVNNIFKSQNMISRIKIIFMLR
jgi:hypothetical protein